MKSVRIFKGLCVIFITIKHSFEEKSHAFKALAIPADGVAAKDRLRWFGSLVFEAQILMLAGADRGYGPVPLSVGNRFGLHACRDTVAHLGH